jgi:hypothetical protein
MRRPGNENDELAVAGVDGFEPLPGRAAIGIVKKRCALDQIGLLQIVFGHRNAPGCGARMEGGYLRSIAFKFHGKGFCDGFARQVIFSRTQAAHEDHNVGPGKRIADCADDVLFAVADNRLERDRNADLIEFFGQVKGVGVLAVRRKHFGADCNDLGFHEGSFQLLALV